ncbi:MAG: DUF3117 domain-containing protein [Phenylobacterium zucineum]|jgi:hypothetical protein|nr:MAG: DUF3117 domain-containing protein [Phenylobacterium zucineum]
MAAQKPRGTDGPLEAEREKPGRIVLKLPVEGGGRMVVSMDDKEAQDLIDVLAGVVRK